MEQKTIYRKRMFQFWIIFSVIYFLVCGSVLLFLSSITNRTQTNINRIRAEQTQKLIQEQRIKGFAENNFGQARQYSQSGVINKEFKQMVSRQEAGKEPPQVRAYQQQLAEYRLRLEEQKQRELERQRQEKKEAQERIALIEQERQERLKQQALQKQEVQTTQAVKPSVGKGSKTFTPIKTSAATKQTPQKTQIGTLKTSKLGESSFQK